MKQGKSGQVDRYCLVKTYRHKKLRTTIRRATTSKKHPTLTVRIQSRAKHACRHVPTQAPYHFLLLHFLFNCFSCLFIFLLFTYKTSTLDNKTNSYPCTQICPIVSIQIKTETTERLIHKKWGWKQSWNVEFCCTLPQSPCFVADYNLYSHAYQWYIYILR